MDAGPCAGEGTDRNSTDPVGAGPRARPRATTGGCPYARPDGRLFARGAEEIVGGGQNDPAQALRELQLAREEVLHRRCSFGAAVAAERGVHPPFWKED